MNESPSKRDILVIRYNFTSELLSEFNGGER
jgi:hypothetical protein